jgi:hypothetical protein
MNTKLAERSINKDIYYINATWRIDKDKLNYILQRKSSSEGKKWRTEGYYQTIAQLYHALVELGIKERSLTDVKELNDKVEELHSLIEKSASIMGGVKHGI